MKPLVKTYPESNSYDFPGQVVSGRTIPKEVRDIVNEYERFEQSHPVRIINSNKTTTPVNFKDALNYPRHRWYIYKEGFSPDIVNSFISRFSKSNDQIVFDPFGGIGTTVLQSAFLSYKSYSNDINPLGNFISKVKSTNYSETDINELKDTLLSFQSSQLDQIAVPPDNPTVLTYFTPVTLDSVLAIQYWIDSIESQNIKNLFHLSLLTILEQVSTHRKDGNGVKKKKANDYSFTKAIVKKLVANRIISFIEDIESSEIKTCPSILYNSSFDQYTLRERADLIITSPPYANCFDYSKVYLIELWFGGFFKKKEDQKIFRQSSISSHIHYTWERRNMTYGHELVDGQISEYLSSIDLWDKKIPNMIKGYFSDLGKVLFELIPNLNAGAILGFVIGNSAYGGLPIPTDILFAELAHKFGFEIVDIEMYRTLTPSSQQLKIIDDSHKKYLRESLITLKWH